MFFWISLAFSMIQMMLAIHYFVIASFIFIKKSLLASKTFSVSIETIIQFLFFSLQSCLTLCDPTDCSLPGSSVHNILQARILE